MFLKIPANSRFQEAQEDMLPHVDTAKPWSYLLQEAVGIKMTCIQVFGQVHGEKKITAIKYKYIASGAGNP